MRKWWIAIAMVALLTGLGAGFRLGRSGKPRQEPVPVTGVAETPPVKPAERGKSLESQAPAAAVPEPTSEVGPSRNSNASEERRTWQPSELERFKALPGSSSPAAPALSTAPEVIEPHVPRATSPNGNTVAPPVSPPVPPTTTAAPTEEPAKEPERAGDADDPESDRRPPELQYLRFDPPETRGGGTSTLSVGSVDDLSGVKLVYGSVRSPSGVASVQFAARDTSGSGVFVATITIPAQAETGEWFVSNLQVADKADNALSVAFARATVPPGGTLRVVSDDPDSTAPEVRQVSVARNAVDAGERNQIIVEVEDDRSGVALVTGAFQSPSKRAFIPFTTAPSGDTSWVGDVPVPANADCGEWTLRQLRVVDKANNTAFLSMDQGQVGHVSFVVSGGGACDSEPPFIDAIYFAPNFVSNARATEIILTVVVHDDVSGVATLSGWIDGPVATNGQAPRISFAAAADARNPDAPLTARITVPQFAAQGIWRVTVAQLSDKARNTRTYNRDDPALRDASFTVD